MELKRVVITGLGVVSPLGKGVKALTDGIAQNKSAVVAMPDWTVYKGLRSLVAAPAKVDGEKEIPRQFRRSMGNMSIFAVQAAQEALADAALSQEVVTGGRMGCIIGSTMGGSNSLSEAFDLITPNKDISLITSMKFFQCVSHTAALNVAQFLGIKGVTMATSAACASSIQALGASYDLIRLGRQDAMLCGGAEELHPTVTGSFDILFATSAGYNDKPDCTPRPFDKNRDGLVCGDGAGILVLESYEHAKARGAKIYAEVTGYSTLCSGLHISQSSKEALAVCIREALAAAQVEAKDIDYINAHATATLQGDTEEAQAIKDIFGDTTPVSSLKGYIGHTLGASGTIELAAVIEMMHQDTIYPTRNLETVDPACEGIYHVTKPVAKKINTVLKNSFALGGLNAAVVIRKI